MFETAEKTRTLDTRYALLKFAQGNESALHIWLNRLKNVSDAEIMTAFEDVPQGRLSPIARQFTVQLLKINQGLILNAGDPL